jgi:hypothetical protein
MLAQRCAAGRLRWTTTCLSNTLRVSGWIVFGWEAQEVVPQEALLLVTDLIGLQHLLAALHAGHHERHGRRLTWRLPRGVQLALPPFRGLQAAIRRASACSRISRSPRSALRLRLSSGDSSPAAVRRPLLPSEPRSYRVRLSGIRYGLIQGTRCSAQDFLR